MSHIEEHVLFKCLLHLLGVFYEESECEDEKYVESEEEACTYELRTLEPEIPKHEEKAEVCYCLIELSGVAWYHIHSFKYERPWHVGRFANYLAVHKVAESDEACRNRHGDGDGVKDCPYIHLQVSAVEQQGEHDAYCAAVARQSFVTGEVPCTVYVLTYGQQHLYDVRAAGEEVFRLIKQTVTQSGAYQYADEAVEEQWFKLLIGQSLLPV